jgi:hypothetical protein
MTRQLSRRLSLLALAFGGSLGLLPSDCGVSEGEGAAKGPKGPKAPEGTFDRCPVDA